MNSKIEKIVKTTGTGAGNLSPKEQELYAAYRREVRERCAAEKSARIVNESSSIAAGRKSEAANQDERRKSMPGSIADRIAVDKARNKIQRQSVRDAIAAHDAGAKPCVYLVSPPRSAGGWDGADRVERAIWRGAARLADSLAKSRGSYIVGPDGRAGMREIVFSQVPAMIQAAGEVSNRHEFRAAIRPLLFGIKSDCKRFFNSLRDERRRIAARELEESGESSMDDWQDRDEFSGGACNPWTVGQLVKADELGISLPRLISSDPRSIARGEPGKRAEIITAGQEVVESATLQAARLFSQSTGKGAGPRLVGARALQTVADCVHRAILGEALPPEEAAGLSSGEQGGIGDAWRKRIQTFKKTVGI